MGRRVWIAAALLLGVAGAITLQDCGGRGGERVPRAVHARVQVVRPQPRRLRGRLLAGGFLRARSDIRISAERPGRVVSLPLADGAPVQAGEVVARLDDAVAQANLDRARIVAREAALSPMAPAADLARAVERLRLAEHAFEQCRPRSPIDGVVEAHHVDPGEYVTPGTPLVDVLDPRTLVLDVDVDADVVGLLDRRAGVPVTVAALGESGALSGRIRRIASRAQAGTRRFRVEVEVPAGRSGARPGMHAEARFTLPAGAPALYLPKAVVRLVRARRGVFLVEKGRARWVPVRVSEVAFRPELWRLDPKALPAGCALVSSGFSGLRDRMAVEEAP